MIMNKATILESVSTKLDQWHNKKESISVCYENETEFMKVAQNETGMFYKKS